MFVSFKKSMLIMQNNLGFNCIISGFAVERLCDLERNGLLTSTDD